MPAAAQNNHEELLPIYRWFAGRTEFVVGPRGGPNPSTINRCQDETRRRGLERLLQAADLGLSGIDFKEARVDDRTRRLVAAIHDALPEEEIDLPDRVPQISFLHRCEDGRSVKLAMHDESSGTLAWFGLLGPVLDTLETGGVLCVDELDASLHPLLALEVVRMFNDPIRNPRGAQLIFNTHDTNLLDSRVLRRDQIWFTERTSAAARISIR